jgi:hypothetical protein
VSFFAVASHLCFAASAVFGFLVTLLGFLELHFGKDKAPICEKLNRVHHALHESTVARLPGALFEFISEFHSPDPRGPLRSSLRHWWLPGALIMLLVADGALAIWYPQDVLEMYRNARQGILNNVPVTLYNDDVTFTVGLIGACILLVLSAKVMNAANKLGARRPFEEPSRFSDAFSLTWRENLAESIGFILVAILAMLLVFGIVVAGRRFVELPLALGVAVSALSFPFLFVLFIYVVIGSLVLLEQMLKVILLCFYWLKTVRRRFGRFVDHEHQVFEFVFDRFEYCVLFVLGISASMTLTFVALALGHALHPELDAPRTWQLFAANAVGGGLILSSTFLVVRWAVARSKLVGRIPLAILFDLGIAATLSCLALYVGLFGTAQALAPGAVFHVLLGFAPDGRAHEFGPYFWTMHTTFLPIALYLLVLLIAWLIKVALDPAAWLVRQAAMRETPLRYLAAAAGIYVAAFSALGVVFKEIGQAVGAILA